MFGGNSMSRCCRHVHLMTRTQHQQSWSISGGRTLSTVSGISTAKLRTWQQSTLSASSRLAMSRKTRTSITAPMSTSNKPPPTPAPTGTESSSNEVKAPSTGLRTVYPERLVIYHAGTGKIFILATLKLTTIFGFAIFDLYAFPTFLAAGAPLYQTAGLAICGLIPLLYVAYTASPYVTTIHMRVPHFARVSAAAFQRFSKAIPPTTPLDLTTLSLIGKPRISSMTVADLQPAKKRLGMVNYERDTTKANAARKWWRFRAVGDFNIQKGNEGKLKTGWVWKTISEVIERRVASGHVGKRE